MLDALESRFSTQFIAPPVTSINKSNYQPVATVASAPTVTGRPIVAGTVPASSPSPSSTPAPIIPSESPQTGYYLDPVPAPVEPSTPVTTPSTPGVLSDGSAGVQVTSGISGSHDTVGISSGLLSSLASIGAPTDSTTSAAGAPVATPTGNSGYGGWILIALAVGAVWFVLK
jgi:hypothetical protein